MSSFNREAKNIMLTDASQAIELYTFICQITRSYCIPRWLVFGKHVVVGLRGLGLGLPIDSNIKFDGRPRG